MASHNPGQNDTQRAVSDALGAHWKLFMFQGVTMIILGVLAIAAPAVATLAVDIYFGWLFLISGIIGLVAMFSAKNIPGFLWSLVNAVLAAGVGAMLIWKPVEGALSLTLVLAAFFAVEGVFQIVASIANRDVMRGSWGWMTASGIADLALAAIIMSGWPTTGAWALGLLVGVNLVTSGWAIAMAAFAGRSTSTGMLVSPIAAARH